MPLHPVIRTLFLALAALALAGCAAMATQRMADNLSRAILNQDDPETVRVGAPAYLLLLDGLIEGSPHDADLLLAGSRLYAAYAAVFVDEDERSKRLAARALDYARRAFCLEEPGLCDLDQRPFNQLDAALDGVGRHRLDFLYGYASAWAVWIDACGGTNWLANAQLPRVEAMMRRVVALDPGHDGGRGQLYLAVMNTLLPPALGGRPEVGREYFEAAVTHSRGRDLMIKVEYARRYARLVFDRELHDRLLKEVLAAEPDAPGLALANALARGEARKLLDGSADFFLE